MSLDLPLILEHQNLTSWSFQFVSSLGKYIFTLAEGRKTAPQRFYGLSRLYKCILHDAEFLEDQRRSLDITSAFLEPHNAVFSGFKHLLALDTAIPKVSFSVNIPSPLSNSRASLTNRSTPNPYIMPIKRTPLGPGELDVVTSPDQIVVERNGRLVAIPTPRCTASSQPSSGGGVSARYSSSGRSGCSGSGATHDGSAGGRRRRNNDFHYSTHRAPGAIARHRNPRNNKHTPVAPKGTKFLWSDNNHVSQRPINKRSHPSMLRLELTDTNGKKWVWPYPANPEEIDLGNHQIMLKARKWRDQLLKRKLGRDKDPEESTEDEKEGEGDGDDDDEMMDLSETEGNHGLENDSDDEDEGQRPASMPAGGVLVAAN
ncbi:hypothetical protein BJ875DRAFT_496951 [Amylocarpus encephaloides]|uniref:Uncharacterized protein n=1 Tax=Amylocarpus encephaloides TaxID=45428 RepID=A0A9P7YG85_9HELO|nr:hypothetical protein BJ875DRAFT_496951 [Amylocarpus encephaloides]